MGFRDAAAGLVSVVAIGVWLTLTGMNTAREGAFIGGAGAGIAGSGGTIAVVAGVDAGRTLDGCGTTGAAAVVDCASGVLALPSIEMRRLVPTTATPINAITFPRMLLGRAMASSSVDKGRIAPFCGSAGGPFAEFVVTRSIAPLQAGPKAFGGPSAQKRIEQCKPLNAGAGELDSEDCGPRSMRAGCSKWLSVARQTLWKSFAQTASQTAIPLPVNLLFRAVRHPW